MVLDYGYGCDRFWKHAVGIIILSVVLIPVMIKTSKFEMARIVGFNNNTAPVRLSNSSFPPEINEYTPVNRRRPRLILHVGPSKSATTSLQTDMTAFQHTLHRDGILYAGRYYNPFVNETTGIFHLNRSETPVVDAAHAMLLDCSLEPRVECCRTFAAELDSFSHSHEFDVILSEEPLGNQWKRTDDWLAIREAVEEHWDVTVVVGYRRFYSWIVSSHFQRERLDRSHDGLNDLWISQGGRAKQPLFPKWLRNYEQTYRHTFHILDALKDVFPVEIINLHNVEHTTPPTLLFCDILKGISRITCQKSRRHDKHPTVINTHTKIPSLYYDSIATAAESNGLVDGTAWNRSTVREAVYQFHEVERGFAPQDLPLNCPDQDQTEELLNFSLWIESEYMSDFYSSSDTVHANHVAGFQSYVNNSVFCWVDTEAVLDQPEWIGFFVSMFGGIL